MFKLIAAPLVWWPVTFPGVADDGSIVENKIELRFSILTEDDFDQYLADAHEVDALKTQEDFAAAREEDGVVGRIVKRIEAITGEGKAKEAKPSVFKAAALAELVSDWKGVHAENEDPLRFSMETLSQLLNVPNVASAALAAYRECRAGRGKVRAGN